MIIKLIKKTAAVAFWILIWQLLAVKIAQPLIVPTPGVVFERLYDLSLTQDFWNTVFYSVWRISVGIAISLVIGVVLGVLVAKLSLIELVVNPLLGLIKATPVASFILLALLWMDSNVLPTFISVLIVVPIVISNVSMGIKSIDKGLTEVAEIFKFSVFRKIKRLYIPSVYPYFMSACRSSLGLAWKAGIAAEVLTVPALSIGKMIYESKLYLETTDLFAWSVVVILLSGFIEFVLCLALSKLGRAYERRSQNNADF